jgi:hypothetical protein
MASPCTEFAHPPLVAAFWRVHLPLLVSEAAAARARSGRGKREVADEIAGRMAKGAPGR